MKRWLLGLAIRATLLYRFVLEAIKGWFGR